MSYYIKKMWEQKKLSIGDEKLGRVEDPGGREEDHAMKVEKVGSFFLPSQGEIYLQRLKRAENGSDF